LTISVSTTDPSTKILRLDPDCILEATGWSTLEAIKESNLEDLTSDPSQLSSSRKI
jgi:hypothetical protein